MIHPRGMGRMNPSLPTVPATNAPTPKEPNLMSGIPTGMRRTRSASTTMRTPFTGFSAAKTQKQMPKM